MLSRALVGWATALVLLNGPAPHAAAQCYDFVEAVFDDDADLDGLRGASSIAVSPDGRHVYATALEDDAVVTFRRDSRTGRIAFLEVDRNGVQGVRGLDAPASVVTSPDGKHVYVAGSKSDAVAAFARDPESGALAFLAAERNGMRRVRGLDGPASLAVSSDGKDVYVASTLADSVVAFRRDSGSGALTFVDAERDAVDGVDGLAEVLFVTPSPDGRHVYAAGAGDRAVALFSRDATTGALTFGEATPYGLVYGPPGADGLITSPDGAHVYVFAAGAVNTFARGAETGALLGSGYTTLLHALAPLSGALSVASSPDGRRLYVTNQPSGALTVLAREPQSGTLDLLQIQSDDVEGSDGLAGARGIAASPDGRHIYVAASEEAAVSVFAAPPLQLIDVEREDVGGIDGLAGVLGVAASPDGERVYTITAWRRSGGSSPQDHGIATFARDPSTGTLHITDVDLFGGYPTQLSVGGDGEHVNVGSYEELNVYAREPSGALSWVAWIWGLFIDDDYEMPYFPESLASSPEGNHLYVGSNIDTLVVFAHDSDAGYLRLRQADVELDVSRNGEAPGGPWHVAVSPDGKTVYSSNQDSSVTAFQRDPTTGALEFLEIERNGEGGVEGLAGSGAILASRDGRHVYVASSQDGTIVTFARGGGGGLEFVEAERDGWSEVATPRIASLDLAADGRTLAAVGSDFVLYQRDPASGHLSFDRRLRGCAVWWASTSGWNGISMAPDGRNAYATSYDAVFVFAPEPATTLCAATALAAACIVARRRPRDATRRITPGKAPQKPHRRWPVIPRPSRGERGGGTGKGENVG